MVAKIKSGKSLIGALNYNENKVRNGKAQLIDASGYFKDTPDLNFQDKLFRLTDLAAGNERTKTNAVHISLNFANGEKLQKELLQQIVGDYMERIGFGNQPYLVYEHSDAGHPHVHIVTTNIQKSGERISLHFLGKTKSEEARKAIELAYKLLQADGQKPDDRPLEKVSLKQLEYGKTETKRAITNVIDEVIKRYKFTSIPELNAVLNQYNITADRGSKDSRMYEKNGLVYWALDNKGHKLGVPIKASSIYGKPTLKMLQERFRLNEVMRKPLKANLKAVVDEVLQQAVSKSQFQQLLHNKDVQVLFRQSEDGRIYGVTFVDHRSKSVFNGSDLGKDYSANSLTANFKKESINNDVILGHSANRTNHLTGGEVTVNDSAGTSIIDTLFKEEHQDLAALGKLQQRKRKKKRKRHSL